MLVLAAVASLVGNGVLYEAINPRFCPPDAIGYLQPIKDGVVVAGGRAKYDPRSGAYIAWFPRDRSTAQVDMTLNFRPNAAGHLELHTEGRGSIRIRRGVFCAFSGDVRK